MRPFGEAMARRLDPHSSTPLAVAFSGGGDSLALLHLTIDWARRHRRNVLALTVDHGLNPLSGDWTRAAGQTVARLGCDWRALAWPGPKPTTGVQAKARAARHALLAAAAREAGARVLLMGHTGDDVAEGEVMRVADAPGLGRLRQWSPSPAWPEGRGVMLLRPLLSARRADLRDLLTARGETWLDDPANDDPRFARIRARRALSGSGASQAHTAAFDPALPALARRFRISATGAKAPLDTVLEARCSVSKPVLSAALLCVSGGSRPPRGPELDRLLCAVAGRRKTTLRGCCIVAQSEDLRITRAPLRHGEVERPTEPTAWIENRFAAASGLYPDEASLPWS